MIHTILQSYIDLAWMWTREEAETMVLETFRGHVEGLEANDSLAHGHSKK